MSRSFVIAALAGLLLSCQPAAAPTVAVAAPPTLDDQGSLYELPIALTDQSGRAIGLDTYRGKLVVISMFYTTCPAACPMLISQIERIEQALPPAVRSETRVLLISFDPARDDVVALERTARARDLDLRRWTMARTSEPDVRTLAAVLGIKYRNLADGSFNHSSVIALLDEGGHIVERVDGLGQAQATLVAALNARVASRHSKSAR